MSSDRTTFQGFRNFQTNFLRAHPAILKLDVDDTLKYTLLVVQHETYGRAYRSKTPQNCFGFYPLTASVLAKRLGMRTEACAIKKLVELQEMGFIELRRLAPNAPYEVRLRWQKTSEPHPKFEGFKPGFSSIEIPNEIFTIVDGKFTAEFRLTLVAVHSHLLSQAHEFGLDPYGFMKVSLVEVSQHLQAAERTVRWRLEALTEMGYLQAERVEGSRKLGFRLTWHGQTSGNETGATGNQETPFGNETTPIGNQNGGIGNETPPIGNGAGATGNQTTATGNEAGAETGNGKTPHWQPEVQQEDPLSYKTSLTHTPPVPKADPEGSEAESPLVGGGVQPAAEKASLLTDPAVLVCLEILEGAGVVLSALQLRKVEGTRSKAEVLQALKGSISALHQGQKITSETVLAALKGGEHRQVQPLAPEASTALPKRLLAAIASQGANRRKFGTLTNTPLRGGVIACALVALAERPERSPWGMSGFGLPTEKRPMDAPPLRLMIAHAEPDAESLPIEVASKVETGFKTLGCAIAEAPSDRKNWSQAVEDLCSATVYALNYLMALDRPDVRGLVGRILREALRFMDTWLVPGGHKTELLKSIDKDVRKQLQDCLEAAEKMVA